MYKNMELKRQKDRERQAKRRDKGVTETPENVTPNDQGVTGLHTKADVNPWGWPKYDSQDRRINPATMEPYGPRMAEILSYSPESITEYERKRVRKDILVIHDLPRAQVDAMYRALVQGYSHRE